jgi:SAM-dependent methyltransferase
MAGGFDVGADAYGRFMGRWSEPLAVLFADQLDLRPGQRALDVGCGPGALTTVLAGRLGADRVRAVDPSASFVRAVAARLPEVDVRRGTAERLPLPDDAVDVAAAQLVVHFMADPVTGLREMGRVTRPGGVVAACVWDHAGGGGPLAVFWDAVRDLDPTAPGEAELPGTREGHLAELAVAAGLVDVHASALVVGLSFAGVQEWWEPFTLGVGPAGAYVAGLDAERRDALRVRCEELLPDGPFELTASAWTVTARAADPA